MSRQRSRQRNRQKNKTGCAETNECTYDFFEVRAAQTSEIRARKSRTATLGIQLGEAPDRLDSASSAFRPDRKRAYGKHHTGGG